MASTAWLNPTTAVSLSAGLGGTVKWTAPAAQPTLVSALKASDDARAYVGKLSAGVNPDVLVAYAFNPSLAADATIQGFEVRYERRGNVTNAARERWVRLTNGTTFIGTSGESTLSATNWTTTDTYVTAGSPTNMWGLTTANASVGLANGNLGVAIRVSGTTTTSITSAVANIDHVQLKIHYNVPITYTTDVNSYEDGYDVNKHGSLVTAKTNWISPATAASGLSIVSAAGDGSISTNFTGGFIGILNVTTSAFRAGFFTNYVLPSFVTNATNMEVFSETWINSAKDTIDTSAATLIRPRFYVAASVGGGNSCKLFSAVCAESGWPAGHVSALVTASLTADGRGLWGLNLTAAESYQQIIVGVGIAYDNVTEVTSVPSTNLYYTQPQIRVTYLTPESSIEITQVTASGGGARDVNVFSAEHGFEADSVDFSVTYNLISVSEEQGYEADSVDFSVTYNLISVSEEQGYEAGSVGLTKVLNITPVSYEDGYEADSVGLTTVSPATTINVDSYEYGYEILYTPNPITEYTTWATAPTIYTGTLTVSAAGDGSYSAAGGQSGNWYTLNAAAATNTSAFTAIGYQTGIKASAVPAYATIQSLNIKTLLYSDIVQKGPSTISRPRYIFASSTSTFGNAAQWSFINNPSWPETFVSAGVTAEITAENIGDISGKFDASKLTAFAMTLGVLTVTANAHTYYFKPFQFQIVYTYTPTDNVDIVNIPAPHAAPDNFKSGYSVNRHRETTGWLSPSYVYSVSSDSFNQISFPTNALYEDGLGTQVSAYLPSGGYTVLLNTGFEIPINISVQYIQVRAKLATNASWRSGTSYSVPYFEAYVTGMAGWTQFPYLLNPSSVWNTNTSATWGYTNNLSASVSVNANTMLFVGAQFGCTAAANDTVSAWVDVIQARLVGEYTGNVSVIITPTINVNSFKVGYENLDFHTTVTAETDWLSPISARNASFTGSTNWTNLTAALTADNQGATVTLPASAVSSYLLLLFPQGPSYTLHDAQIRTRMALHGNLSQGYYQDANLGNFWNEVREYPSLDVSATTSALWVTAIPYFHVGTSADNTLLVSDYSLYDTWEYGTSFLFSASALASGSVWIDTSQIKYIYLTDSATQQSVSIEVTSGVVTKNAEVFSTEHGYEADSVVFSVSYNLISVSEEQGYESSSPALVQKYNLNITPSEYGYESSSPALVQKYNLNITPSEYGFDADSISITQILSNAAEVFSFEHGFESSSPTFTQLHNLNITSSEYGFDSYSLSILRIYNQLITSSEYGFDSFSPSLIKKVSIPVVSYEDGFELFSPPLTRKINIPVVSYEDGFESYSGYFTYLAYLNTTSSEYAFELSSVYFNSGAQINAVSCEYSYEVAGGSLTRKIPMSIATSEYSYEIFAPTQTKKTNLGISSYESGFDSYSAYIYQLFGIRSPGNEHGFEAKSVNYSYYALINTISGKYGYEDNFIELSQLYYSNPDFYEEAYEVENTRLRKFIFGKFNRDRIVKVRQQ